MNDPYSRIFIDVRNQLKVEHNAIVTKLRRMHCIVIVARAAMLTLLFITGIGAFANFPGSVIATGNGACAMLTLLVARSGINEKVIELYKDLASYKETLWTVRRAIAIGNENDRQSALAAALSVLVKSPESAAGCAVLDSASASAQASVHVPIDDGVEVNPGT